MIIDFDRLYPELVCDDAPVTNDYRDDPWDREKPHAEDGLRAKYCIGEDDEGLRGRRCQQE